MMRLSKAIFRCIGLTLYGVNLLLLSAYVLYLIDPSFLPMNAMTFLILSPLSTLLGVKLTLAIKNNVRTLFIPMTLYACLFFFADKTLLSVSLLLVVAGYLLEDFIAVQVLDAITQQEKTRKSHLGTFSQDLWLEPIHKNALASSQTYIRENKLPLFDMFDPFDPFNPFSQPSIMDPANPLSPINLPDDHPMSVWYE